MSKEVENVQNDVTPFIKWFYRIGPIIVSLVFLFLVNNDAQSSVSFTLVSMICGIPGAYIGLVLALLIKAFMSDIAFFGSLGSVIGMKLLMIFLPLIGMMIGSFITGAYGCRIFLS